MNEPTPLLQSQCEVLKKRAQSRFHQETHEVVLSSENLVMYPPKRRQDGSVEVALSLRQCLSCDGATAKTNDFWKPSWLPSVKAAKAEELSSVVLTFEDEHAAEVYAEDVLPRLRTSFLLKVEAGETGPQTSVLGYAVYDSCSPDETLMSSGSIPDHRRKTTKAGACVARPPILNRYAWRGEGDQPRGLDAPVMRKLVAGLKEEASYCFTTYGVRGQLDLTVRTLADGRVDAIDDTGDFSGTPTGVCVQEAVEKRRFPATGKPAFYRIPLSLQ